MFFLIENSTSWFDTDLRGSMQKDSWFLGSNTIRYVHKPNHYNGYFKRIGVFVSGEMEKDHDKFLFSKVEGPNWGKYE